MTAEKKNVKKQKRREINDDSVFYVLRKTGYTIPQARRVNIHQIQSQGALDTLIDNHHNDTSYFEVVRDEDGVARTAVEIQNPELTKSKFKKLLAVYYTTETRLKDLESLIAKATVPINSSNTKHFKNEEEQVEEWKHALRRKFGSDAVR